MRNAASGAANKRTIGESGEEQRELTPKRWQLALTNPLTLLRRIQRRGIEVVLNRPHQSSQDDG
jgi:hypothetical protein